MSSQFYTQAREGCESFTPTPKPGEQHALTQCLNFRASTGGNDLDRLVVNLVIRSEPKKIYFPGLPLVETKGLFRLNYLKDWRDPELLPHFRCRRRQLRGDGTKFGLERGRAYVDVGEQWRSALNMFIAELEQVCSNQGQSSLTRVPDQGMRFVVCLTNLD